MTAGVGGATAAAAAAAHEAKMREEEERLTAYTQNDLDGWEFKIVRSYGKITGERFRELCEDENRNGWELMEKFDDYRVRFKRRIQCREQDAYAVVDPYRTHIGMSDLKLVLVVLGSFFAVIAVVVAAVAAR